jgi:hypothetical protein
MTEFARRENRMFNGRYTTDPLRVALSLLAGAATYAILTVLWSLSPVMWGPSFRATPLPSRHISYSGALYISYSGALSLSYSAYRWGYCSTSFDYNIGWSQSSLEVQ